MITGHAPHDAGGPGLTVVGQVKLTAFGNIVADNSFVGLKPGESPDCSIQVSVVMSTRFESPRFNPVSIPGILE